MSLVESEWSVDGIHLALQEVRVHSVVDCDDCAAASLPLPRSLWIHFFRERSGDGYGYDCDDGDHCVVGPWVKTRGTASSVDALS